MAFLTQPCRDIRGMSQAPSDQSFRIRMLETLALEETQLGLAIGLAPARNPPGRFPDCVTNAMLDNANSARLQHGRYGGQQSRAPPQLPDAIIRRVREYNVKGGVFGGLQKAKGICGHNGSFAVAWVGSRRLRGSAKGCDVCPENPAYAPIRLHPANLGSATTGGVEPDNARSGKEIEKSRSSHSLDQH